MNTTTESLQTASTNPNQALWEKGDFTRIAETMRESGDALVAKLGVTRGMRVLGLGCGDGTTALPEARRGAEVLGVDIARNLVEAGNRRARASARSARCDRGTIPSRARPTANSSASRVLRAHRR